MGTERARHQWIYPNDKILIRPVTAITEAKPPEPEPEPQAPAAPAPVVRVTPAPVPAPAPAEPKPAGAFVLSQPKPAPEVKFDDLYCSGFVRTAPVSKDLKVISKFDATGAVLATETDYVYLSHGSEDGIATGNVYQVIRPTKKLKNPNARAPVQSDLGMHYLEVGQIKVILARPDFSLARVMHTCGDAVEVGDIMMPFARIVLPERARSRSFSPTMTAAGGIKGSIVSTKGVLLNFGSTFKVSSVIPGVRGNDRLGAIERGLASDGSIVYIDIGQDTAVKPGAIFILYREIDLDQRLYDLPKEVEKLKRTRTAIGELIVLKAGERASTALVTYASDALVPGDAVERR